MLSTCYLNCKNNQYYRPRPRLTMTQTWLDSTELVLAYFETNLVELWPEVDCYWVRQSLASLDTLTGTPPSVLSHWQSSRSRSQVSCPQLDAYIQSPRTDIRTCLLSCSSIIWSSIRGPDALKKEGRGGFVTREGGGGGGEKGGWKGSGREKKRNWLSFFLFWQLAVS